MARRSRTAPRRPRRGFTLVELLVVIGIIAMLIGILLPALGRARQVAQRTVCLTHLHQIGTLMLSYANENHGLLIPLGPLQDGVENAPGPVVTVAGSNPPIYYYQTLGTNVYPWLRWPRAILPGPYMKVPDPADQPKWLAVEGGGGAGDPLGTLAQPWTSPLMSCPSDPQPGAAHSYLFNNHLCRDQKQVLTYSRKPPNDMTDNNVVVLGEKRTGFDDYYMEKEDFPVDNVQNGTLKVDLYRHGAKLGSNYLYKDMHAEPKPPRGLTDQVDPWDINKVATPDPVKDG